MRNVLKQLMPKFGYTPPLDDEFGGDPFFSFMFDGIGKELGKDSLCFDCPELGEDFHKHHHWESRTRNVLREIIKKDLLAEAGEKWEAGVRDEFVSF